MCNEEKIRFKVPDINLELVHMRAELPVKLAQLSRLNGDVALRILQDWGDGAKPLKILHAETLAELDKAIGR